MRELNGQDNGMSPRRRYQATERTRQKSENACAAARVARRDHRIDDPLNVNKSARQRGFVKFSKIHTEWKHPCEQQGWGLSRA